MSSETSSEQSSINIGQKKKEGQRRRHRSRKTSGKKQATQESKGDNSSDKSLDTSQDSMDMEKKFKTRNALKLQRTIEVEQVCRAGGSDLVMLRKGQYVTTYSLSFYDKNKNKVKCTFGVPLDYPQSAIKLQKPKDMSPNDPYLNVIRNFNAKSKHMLKNKQPLVVQLNYLISKFDELQESNFSHKEKLETVLMSKIAC